jgi:phosphatidylserine decarboxylase
MSKLSLFLFSLLPTNLISKIAGVLANAKGPKFLVKFAISLFIKLYKININEFEHKDISLYKSFNDFFTRKLDRYIISDSLVVSPVCAKLIDFGNIELDGKINIKGSWYEVREFILLENEDKFFGGKFLVFYLSPRDYHRIHFPIDGRLKKIYYIRGRLFPVNEWGVKNVKRLFARNERITMILETKVGMVVMVLVGAFLVGSIKLDFLNELEYSELVDKGYIEKEYIFSKGDMVGSFCFGSTVILFFEKGDLDFYGLKLDKHFSVGEALINKE